MPYCFFSYLKSLSIEELDIAFVFFVALSLFYSTWSAALTQLSDWLDVATTARILPTSGDTRLCPPAIFSGWGLPASLAFWEPHFWGFTVLSRNLSTLQVLSQNVWDFHRLAAGHRWVTTHRLEVLHGILFFFVRLVVTSPHHSPLFLLRLHLPVLLQRLLQPLSLLL